MGEVNPILEHKSLSVLTFSKRKKKEIQKGLRLENFWGTKKLKLCSIVLSTGASLTKEVKVNSAALLTKQVNLFCMNSYKLFARFLNQALGMNYEWN